VEDILSPHPVFDVRSEDGTKRWQNIHRWDPVSSLYEHRQTILHSNGRTEATIRSPNKAFFLPIDMLNNPWRRDDAMIFQQGRTKE